MPMNDVFTPDAYGVIPLTNAIIKAPVKPGRIGAMGIFKSKGVAQNSIAIEEQNRILTLLPTARRGSPGTPMGRGDRKMRTFNIPHIPTEDVVLAAEVQGVRAFGTESQTQGVAGVVADRLQSMRESHEATWEYMRVGALHGLIKDGAGTTIYNLFTEFGLTERTKNFVLGTSTTNIKQDVLTVKRWIEEGLGGVPFSHIHAICGRNWFDALVNHEEVKYAYQFYKEGAFLREDQRKGFEFLGVIFEEYTGKVGGVPFVDPDVCRFFPAGAGIYQEYMGPADFIEAVNTVGKPIYAKQETMPYDRGINVHAQSNHLPLCLRPEVLIAGTKS